MVTFNLQPSYQYFLPISPVKIHYYHQTKTKAVHTVQMEVAIFSPKKHSLDEAIMYDYE